MSLTSCERHLYTENDCYIVYDSTKLHDCPFCKALKELETTKLKLHNVQESLDNTTNQLINANDELHNLKLQHDITQNKINDLEEEINTLLN